jgi:hypothetical protein
MRCYSCNEDLTRTISEIISKDIGHKVDFIGDPESENQSHRIIYLNCVNCNELILGSIDLRNKSNKIGFDVINIDNVILYKPLLS